MVDDREVRRIMRADKGLALGLLRYANSAWVGRRQRVQSVDEAITVLGLAGVRSVVLTGFTRTLFTAWGPVEEFLWEHALASGIAAALERPSAGKTTEDLYLSGLLHNVGKAALNAADPAAYRRVVARVLEAGVEFSEAELALIGVTHATVGGELLQNVAVPPTVKLATSDHHERWRTCAAANAVCEQLLRADATAYRASDAWARLRGEHPEPPWIASRLARSDVAPAVLAMREEAIRIELQRMRSFLQTGTDRS